LGFYYFLFGLFFKEWIEILVRFPLSSPTKRVSIGLISIKV
jgi:hypothetical protein